MLLFWIMSHALRLFIKNITTVENKLSIYLMDSHWHYLGWMAKNW